MDNRARQPQYLREYAEQLFSFGTAAFLSKYRNDVLLGVGMTGRVSERPRAWGRRTLSAEDMGELQQVRSVLDRIWHLRKGEGARGGLITLGQAIDNDLVVPEYTVSTQHCAFGYEGRALTVRDLDSLNGTTINSVPLADGAMRALRSSDVLTIGRVKVRYLRNQVFLRLVFELAAAAAA